MASGRVPKTKRIFFAMMWGKITVSSGINPLGASIRLVQASAWCKPPLGASPRLVQAQEGLVYLCRYARDQNDFPPYRTGIFPKQLIGTKPTKADSFASRCSLAV